MRIFCVSLSCLLFSFTCVARVYRNAILTEDIKTLQINKEGQWNAYPLINLHSDERVHISFDQLSHDYKQYAYRLIHCNADWTNSGLNELEYMEGFSLQDINDYELSEGTLNDYTHYKLELPHERLKLKLSGNYALLLVERDSPEEVLATACFSVLEARIGISSQISTSTDLGHNTSYQQLSFALKTSPNQIERPESDLKILVRQNRRIDNEVFGLRPLMSASNEILYEHLTELIFEGGNEYRRFEINTYKLAGLGVDKIRFKNSAYQAQLLESSLRTQGYTYDKDQNGRFYIRNMDADDDQHTRADYFWVQFSLKVPLALRQSNIYLLGDFTYTSLDEAYRMKYNPETACLENEVLLKQGSYNYLYLSFDKAAYPAGGLKRSNSDPRVGSAFPIEGSYWETENEYQIFVYYRPVGAQYDAMIAYEESK